jgi:Asp-tRNA(Asn)/Glu-tRNA(Gln) amidotransferase A subunit family amidase
LDEPNYLSAIEALDMFRHKTLSPVELMQAVIKRAEEVEPAINAFGVKLYDEAMGLARSAEREYFRKGGRPRPLEGLPFAVKEETPVKGQRTTQGSLIYKDWIPGFTAVCIERVVAAGAIIHARTNAPEFSCAPFTHSKLWGITRNPWNLDYSPGGSSGGSGAALAAGTTTLANGSDIGGSIRIPAAACGVVGFKPPYGRVPEFSPFNLDHYCHEGPMARTVAECALLENSMAGQDSSDLATVSDLVRIPAVAGAIKGWRVAVSRDVGGFEVDAAVTANLMAAAEVLRQAGCIVEEVDIGWKKAEIIEAAFIHFGVIFGPFIERHVMQHPDLVTTYSRAFAARTADVTKADYLRGLEMEGLIWAQLAQVLAQHEVLLAPTFAVPALEAGREYLGEEPDPDGVVHAGWERYLTTIPFNICSRCPVLSVPSGFAGTGVPTGAQIVGRPFDDVSAFAVASVVEQLGPWTSIGMPRPRFTANV